jgi:hypothetical protein
MMSKKVGRVVLAALIVVPWMMATGGCVWHERDHWPRDRWEHRRWERRREERHERPAGHWQGRLDIQVDRPPVSS